MSEHPASTIRPTVGGTARRRAYLVGAALAVSAGTLVSPATEWSSATPVAIMCPLHVTVPAGDGRSCHGPLT